jgi:pyruvate kinase
MSRLTKLICTLGPACNTPEKIESLARAGMNVARLNFSHGNWDGHRKVIQMLQDLNKKLAAEGKVPSCVGILLDTKGAEIRTSDVAEKIQITRGQTVVFSYKPLPNEKRQVIIVDHKGFGRDAKDAERILLDNGEIIFEIVSIQKDGSVVAKAQEPGSIGSRRHVNLPGASLDMPSITEHDWETIKHGAEEDVDFLALSFIREGKEIEEVRKYLTKKGKKINLIAKIETREAAERMDEIIEASDGIMVARGDLGAEMPFEKVPVLQNELVSRCRKAGKPVIVATHMLESMIKNPIPTRAEVTDIAHATNTLTDSTMLSGETAGGAHPLLAIDAMNRVITETEKHMRATSKMHDVEIRDERDARAEAAVRLAISSEASAIVVITKSGKTAQDVSRFRPSLPIIAFTENAAVQRELQLHFGVRPFVTKLKDDPEATVAHATTLAIKAGLLKKGQSFVLLTDSRAHDERVSTVQVREVR